MPPPAVVNLFAGAPTYMLDLEGETVTPTGAGLAVGLAEFGPTPPMRLLKTGLGAGFKDFAIPNVVRLMVGETEADADLPCHEVVLLEANLDDMSPDITIPSQLSFQMFSQQRINLVSEHFY